MITKFKRLTVSKTIPNKPGFRFEDYYTGTITINESGVLIAGCIKPQYIGKKEVSVFLRYSEIQEIELEYEDGGMIFVRDLRFLRIADDIAQVYRSEDCCVE